jgi:hypothetical protein
MAAVLLCAACSGSAQNSHPGQFQYFGAGGLSCGKRLDERKGENWYPLGQWALGWVSAAGAYNVRGALRETDAVCGAGTAFTFVFEK